MKMLFKLLAPAALILATSTNVVAIDINAGPIWNNDDAKRKCPTVCSGLVWNKHWDTIQSGAMSVCGTTVGVDIPVGAISSDMDAQTKCPAQLANVSWNGNWVTTEQGKMSVCGCNPPTPVQ